MACALCQAPGSFTAADRRCAFGPDGKFRSGGHFCGTIEALHRLTTFDVPTRKKAMHLAFIRGEDETMLLLAWRGSMAQVDFACLLGPLGEAIESAPLTLDVAETFIASARRTA